MLQLNHADLQGQPFIIDYHFEMNSELTVACGYPPENGLRGDTTRIVQLQHRNASRHLLLPAAFQLWHVHQVWSNRRVCFSKQTSTLIAKITFSFIGGSKNNQPTDVSVRPLLNFFLIFSLTDFLMSSQGGD